MPPEDRHSGVPGGGGSGADVKSGTVAVSDGNATGVTFATAFASVPSVSVVLDPSRLADDSAFVNSVTVNGFTIVIFKGHGGSGHGYDAHWIATDAGDP